VGHLSAMGWLELLPMRLVRFADVGLPDDKYLDTIFRIKLSYLWYPQCPGA
jgi:hypothetical protein